ncbi:MAG: DUF3160 domain-containing protein [bacterium]
MRTFTQFLFPSKKAGNPNISCPGLLLAFILIVLVTISFFAPSHAQQLILNIEDNFIFYPLILMNNRNPSDYLLNLNYNYWIPPYLNNISNLPAFYPVRYLYPEYLFLSNPWGFYHRTLFLPPFIYRGSEYEPEYSWFLPFTQYVIDNGDVKSGIEIFMEKYNLALNEAANLAPQDLVLKFPEGGYITDLGLKTSEANFYNLVKQETGLTLSEEERINENGFVVSKRINYKSFGDAYLDFFYKDLPVFISTDSILQALHKSYDLILADIEQQFLMDNLESILSKAQAALPQIIPEPAGILADAYHDLNVFYTVARKLLGRHPTYYLPFLGDTEVQAFLSHINQLSFEWVDIFGEPRKIDFSQFKPRGHYTRSEEFKSYFKAMIWLGRIDFRVEDPRQLLDAYLVWRSVEEGGARAEWDDMDKIIGLMVGEPDALNLTGIAMLMEEAGVKGPEDLLDEEIQSRVLSIMEKKGYGEQRICSHYLESDPMDPKVAEMPKSFTFMGQRFTVDSHVFSNVVFDRIVVDGVKIERMLPDPLDAMFVLGNNRALHYLQDELTTWQYQGNLYILRYLLDQYNREFWESNMYNCWLDALRSLSGPFEGEEIPRTLCTPAYRDKLLHTQLASWAELRHDTILYVKQSYTGFPICDYPDGYVEPVPVFYKKLKDFSNKAKEIFDNINIPDSFKSRYTSHFEGFADTMEMLETIAQKQIDGQPRMEEETQFIKDTIIEKDRDVICAIITYHDGWYPKLFYGNHEQCMRPDFIVADVHTNPADAQVLHVGVGKVNVIYFITETCSGPTIYVGPVFSYYERTEGGMKRLDDEDWADLVNGGSLTAPEWTKSFLL